VKGPNGEIAITIEQKEALFRSTAFPNPSKPDNLDLDLEIDLNLEDLNLGDLNLEDLNLEDLNLEDLNLEIDLNLDLDLNPEIHLTELIAE
jgi:hypothetical protein